MKHSVYLFQPQTAIESGDEKNYWLPYSVACIWSYVNQFDEINEHFILKNIFFKREDHATVLNKMENPSIVGFSCYIWNENYCLALAEKIKNKWPNCLILFGGEQVSERYLDHDFIDCLVLNEGEQAFLDILKKFKNNEPIPSTVRFERLTDLDIPSPYLDGTMDIIVKHNPDLKWATTLESNRGCPYSCTFCDWGGALQAKLKKFSLEKIQAELDWIKNNNVVYLFFADANFGIFKERDKTIAEMIRLVADQSALEAVNLQYAKNNTESVFEIGKTLGPYNRGVTVSVQSMFVPTLEAIKRTNLKVNDISRVLKLSEEHNVSTYTEVILGLPLETEESWKDGLAELLEVGQHQSIDFNLAEVLENSEFNQPVYKEKYGIKTRKLGKYYTLNEDDYPESGEIVYETSTMDTPSMINSYMYAWMIVHCHINGYTQLYSKCARYVHNISYRTFYDKLFEKLHKPGVIGDHFLDLKNRYTIYLNTGDLDNWPEKGDSFHFGSHKFCYDNKEYIFDLGQEVMREFDLDIAEISKLQRLAIYDLHTEDSYPKNIESNLDIFDWTNAPTKYQLVNEIEEIKKQNVSKGVAHNYKRLNFWFMRRKNLLKNKFIKVT